MQLDNIIYDKDSLARAIAEQWNLESTTFKALYPSDTAVSLVNGMAAYGSMLQYMLVAQLANCYIDTAFSESAVYQLADTLGNNLHGNSAAKVIVDITRENLIYKDIVIPADSEFEIQNRKFFNPSAVILPSGIKKVTDINLTQGEVQTITRYTSGVVNEKIYFGSDFEVDNESVKVWVNDEEWSVEDSFIPYDQYYVSDDEDLQTVVLKTTADGRCYIKFGNGDFGALPSSGSVVKIRYVINAGERGNIQENNIEGTLNTPLAFVDNDNKDVNLKVIIITTVPAFGGFGKQSVTTLRETSPNVFASGHRLIRRSDYKSFLQNKLGYITSQVWGEYEEAKTQGIDDAIMMNVVYYTGLKSYEFHPYYFIDDLQASSNYTGSVGTTRGFYGSYAIRIVNTTQESHKLVYKDNNGKGILFLQGITEDQDIDDLTTSLTHAEYNTQWLDNKQALSAGNVRLEAHYGSHSDVPGSTSDEDKPSNPYNILSTNSKSFVALHTPSLQNPIQIVLDFNEINSSGDTEVKKAKKGISIAGFKFKPRGTAPFIGQFAVYATCGGDGNIDGRPSLFNIRNNTNWTKIVDKQALTLNGTDYSDWIATNCFIKKQEYERASIDDKDRFNDSNAKDVGDVWSYLYYVIEIYSATVSDNSPFEIEEMKIKYNFDYTSEEATDTYIDMSSKIDYEENCKLNIKFPQDVINDSNHRLWSYTSTISGLTASNGYRTGDILYYVYTDVADEKPTSIPFRVTIQNIMNQTYLVEVGNIDNILTTKYTTKSLVYSNVLTSTKQIEIKNNENLIIGYRIEGASGDERSSGGDFYIIKAADITNQGIEVSVGETLQIKGTNDETSLPLTLEVADIEDGKIKTAFWCNNTSFNVQLAGNYEVYKLSDREMNASNKVCDIALKTSNTTPILPAATGGKIKITSSPNLEVEASFTGNRISKNSTDSIDQVLLNKYNHFTTSVEFKQPEVYQVDIKANVCLSTSANITSASIIQNIKNAIQKLFDITPNYMGAGLKISDVYGVIRSVENVKYCNVITPTTNVETPPNKFMVLGDLDITEIVENYQ